MARPQLAGSRTDMTPRLASKLTIHSPEAPATGLAGGSTLVVHGAVVAEPPPLRLVDGGVRRRTTLRRREWLQRRLLAVADLLGATVALLVVLSLLGDDRPGLATLAGMPLVIVLFKIAGLYDRDQMRLVRSTLDEAPVLGQLVGLYVLGLTILQPVLIEGQLGAGQIVALWVASFLSIVAARMAARWIAAQLSAVERCLVVGDPRMADRIREKLASSSARASVAATLPLEGDDVADLGGPEAIRRVVDELEMDRIIVALSSTEDGGVEELIRIARAAGVRVSVLPSMLEVVGSAVELEDVDGMTILGVRPFGLSRSSLLLKRVSDLVATGVGLLVVGPIIAALSLAIKLDSKGPIFFRQVRVGRDGRPFEIVKFRSMVVGADERKAELLALNEVGDGMFKLSRDPRVTRVGSFLRRTSLDELPQLFNVLRGEMSLVGPRPLVTDEDARVLGLDRSRLYLTPGMTGPWQVLGTRVPMAEMVAIDYLYVANWSLWGDLKVLVRTLRHVLRSGNV
jgi:exopolysaccharide biosynthesis polyprenyl glycosylphosphotransferase